MKGNRIIEKPRAGSPRKPSVHPDDSVLDTSRLSKAERDALELAESARVAATPEYRSFAEGLFMGRFDLADIHPFPEQSKEDHTAGAPFLEALDQLLSSGVDADAIDADGEIPDTVITKLAELGAFGIKVPREYGGLGLSQTNYGRAAMLLGSHCANLTALISAHQSIGVPQPLKLFGTEEQKRRFLPRVATGEISAFALTETEVSSDPAQMKTRAEPAPDGQHFIINGEKLWCTNGTRAGVIIVMARTPDAEFNGKPRRQITAFIVEMNAPGVEVVTRCHFMGLRALYNGVIRFRDVKVPRENIVGGEGRGLKVALTTLNTGRLTLPAACTGFAKRCLQIVREWAAERVQWGHPIGHHAAVADKIAMIAANTFAMESMVLLTSALVDREVGDIRLETAMAKMWGSEMAWRIVDETMQIRGGRGYETAASLRARGEPGIPVERMMRDARINLIFEGSSEIMRLLLAREALDNHLKVAGPMLDSRKPAGERFRAGLRAAGFYAFWYPGSWLPGTADIPSGLLPHSRTTLMQATADSRRLARALFHGMARFGPKLDQQQLFLGRIVEIGTEIFATTAAVLRADAMLRAELHPDARAHVQNLVDFFARESASRRRNLFARLRRNNDAAGYRLARSVLDGHQRFVEHGIAGNS